MSELQKKLRLHQEGTCVSSLLHMFRNHNVAVVCMLCFAWWIKDLGQHVSCAAACCCCCCLLTFYIHFYLFFSQFFLFSFFTAHYRHRIRDKSLDTWLNDNTNTFATKGHRVGGAPASKSWFDPWCGGSSADTSRDRGQLQWDYPKNKWNGRGRNFSLFCTMVFLVLIDDTYFCFQYRLLSVKIF